MPNIYYINLAKNKEVNTKNLILTEKLDKTCSRNIIYPEYLLAIKDHLQNDQQQVTGSIFSIYYDSTTHSIAWQ